ncbi:LptF/LptG family permease [Candidatus Liberibacter asiaticus]|uniref:Permease n=1 Tax=Candidatus Liberibacter asiaticus str. gxpsy TaxID=1174529 RepID=A0ABM5NET5_LIBAS|nr:LptF/LptG family permease [Candidatus Liberibacter asiaticus]AGH16630.1 permease [Candidatus Liberibacter asiaticus str. gxpsy]KRF68990.1 permease [Candidatus Liberibacter asiaticus]WCM58681.1 LptF/LptG family permease [Candidatus Liberibacter asiaticus]
MLTAKIAMHSVFYTPQKLSLGFFIFPMKSFELYILRCIGRSFLMSCLFIVFIAWVIQILQRINLVSSSTESLNILLKISGYLIPTVLPMVTPFCFAMETTNVLTSMNRNTELLIIDNTGTSRITLIKPVLFLAILLSIFLFISENIIEPKCRSTIKQLSAKAQLALTFSYLEENLFFRLDDDLYIKISKYNPNNTLQGIFIVDSRDTQTHKIYYAQSGSIDLDRQAIILNDGEVHRKSPISKDISIMKFKSYTLQTESANSSTIVLKANDQNLSFLLNPNPNNPNYRPELLETYRSEFHKRLTQWLFPVIFGLISIVAADKRALVRQRKKIHPIFISLSISFGVFWGFSYIIHKIEQNPYYIPILYLFLFCISSIFLLMIKKKYTKI